MHILIIIKLQGGLGNQLFQYAAAKTLALKLGVQLKLDITTALGEYASEQANTVRIYELGKFVIDDEFATDAEICRFRLSPMKIAEFNILARAKRKILKIIERLSFTGNAKYYLEPTFSFDKQFWLLNDDTYLEGYFQSYKYFENIAALLRGEFMIKQQSHTAIKLHSGEGIPCESVSVHVRRGDYVTNEETNTYHGVCSLKYYQAAMKLIAGRVENPLFYVFSDDLEWCKANLVTEYRIEFVDWCQSPQEELLLMCQCRHNIIANSSFSWWGAWLNVNPEKIVIAPKKWFNVKKDTSDLMPDSWLRI
ncbi:MAG: alpha-1,2-fucosyltransferase [Negativicutes bacterium]